jgi:hypothetical protein
LGEQKKNKRPKAGVFVPPTRGFFPQAGGKNTPGQKIKETKEKISFYFLLFFPRGIFTPR